MKPYAQFHKTSSKDKAINTLNGIIQGISVDNQLSDCEIELLDRWINTHTEYSKVHPFKEFNSILTSINSDGIIDEDERADLLWLCNNISASSTKYYDYITADLQSLHGLVQGILSDNEISDSEIKSLSAWIMDHEELNGMYPYDELNSVISSILKDGEISDDERLYLKRFFIEFTDTTDFSSISLNDVEELKNSITIDGICATCPEICFENTTFAFTGLSAKTSRDGFRELVESLNCNFKSGISQSVNYLVVANEGNRYWAYSCYGRKIEQAIELRKKGHPIVIVHEFDFWDAVADV